MTARLPAGERPGSDPPGLLIIRAWAEEDATLRAHIVCTTDVTRSVQVVRSADSAEEVGAIVEEWLSDLAASIRRPARP